MTKWQLDRSEATRKALAIAASLVEMEQTLSKEELLKKSKFIGSDSSSEITSSNYQDFLKVSLRKKASKEKSEKINCEKVADSSIDIF